MKKPSFLKTYSFFWIIFGLSLGLVTLLDYLFFDYFSSYRGPDIYPNNILGPPLILIQFIACYYLLQAVKQLPLQKVKNDFLKLFFMFLLFGGTLFAAFVTYCIVALMYSCHMGIDCF